MTRLVFAAFFGLIFLLFPCKGQISLPPGGNRLYGLPGRNVTIAWGLTVNVADLQFRSWAFVSYYNKSFADIVGDGNVKEIPQYSPGPFTIKKPSTLILKNVTIKYDGNCRFNIFASGQHYSSEVTVIIEVVPTVSLSCSRRITVNEGDNVTCVCRGQGGNPPADISWYKDGAMIGSTGKEEKTLTLTKVDKTASGTYECAAKSHTLTDEKSIEIIVYYAVPPTVVSLTSTPENVVFGESVVITCEAVAVPLPSYTIIHNDTEIVSAQKTYIITVLEYSHAGSYKCIATNHLGDSSKIFSLSVAETQTTNAPTTENFRTGITAQLEEMNRSGTEWYIVVVSLVSGIIIGIFLSYIVSCSRRKFTSRNPQSNPEPQPIEVDTTYQELDLSKMNTEDNYQSLRVNAASNDAANDDDSTYTELNKTRDVENNYQSLT